MSYSKSAFVTIIPPSGKSFEANIDYGKQPGGGIEGIILPGNIVSSLGMFLGRRHTLVFLPKLYAPGWSKAFRGEL
jgi:hypothetical protein